MWGEITTWLTPGQFTLRHIHIYIRDNSTVFLLLFFFFFSTVLTSKQPAIPSYQNITFDDFILTLCNSNITFDNSFVTFGFFFLTFDGFILTLRSSSIICDSSFSHLVVPLFFLILSSSNITFNSTFVHDFEIRTRLYGPIGKPLKPSFLRFF